MNELVLTRKRARDSFATVRSTEEIRREMLDNLAKRQETLRAAMAAGPLTASSNQMELSLFTALDHAPHLALSRDLSWILTELGRLVKKNMARKHVAGERSVHHPLGPGLWHSVIAPLLSHMGATISADGTTLGLSSTMLIRLFSLVEIDLTNLVRDTQAIRLAANEVISVTRKRQNLYILFWCERQLDSGEFILR